MMLTLFLGRLQIFGLAPDCEEISPLTGVSVYSNNTDECESSLTAGPGVMVAETVETYTGAHTMLLE